MKLSHIPVSVRSRTCTEHGIPLSLTSILAEARIEVNDRRIPCVDVNLTRTVPVAFPGIFEAWNEVGLWLLHRSLVGLRSGRFCRRFDQEFDFIPSFVTSRALLTTRQDGGVLW